MKEIQKEDGKIWWMQLENKINKQQKNKKLKKRHNIVEHFNIYI